MLVVYAYYRSCGYVNHVCFQVGKKQQRLFTLLTEIANHDLVIYIIGVISNNLLSYLLIYRSIRNNTVCL